MVRLGPAPRRAVLNIREQERHRPRRPPTTAVSHAGETLQRLEHVAAFTDDCHIGIGPPLAQRNAAAIIAELP
jgi:hypothetical protein